MARKSPQPTVTEEAAVAATVAPSPATESAAESQAPDQGETAGAQTAPELDQPQGPTGEVQPDDAASLPGNNLPGETPPGEVLIVTGPKKGRWRIGRRFGPEPVEIPLADLTEAQALALRDDPKLKFALKVL
jgi:hypothetical protein